MRKAADTGNPITAKEIGRRLGLSQPTVSRILSGAAGHRVSAETRKRVLDTAAEMGYRPNAVARSLRRRRTNIVGFYTGYGYLDARNPFQAELIGGLQRAADRRRLDILLHGVFRGVSTDDIFGELMDGRIDGLFLVTHDDDPLVARLRDSSLPVVAIADAIEDLPSVVADDDCGTRLLLDHLWSRGHRRIGYLRPAHRFVSVERRMEAFRAYQAERGMIDSEDAPVFELDFEYTKPALEKILAMPEGKWPTAICCWNDMTAFDLLYNCRRMGVAVPETLAVVGFDGLLADPRLNPRALVTAGASWTDIADEAMELLTRQIDGRIGEREEFPAGSEPGMPAPDRPPLIRLPVTLMDGDTV